MKTFSRSILFVSILALLAVATSCKDDDDEVTKSRTELLTQQTWKFSSVKTANADMQTILTAFLTGSEITFKKDFSYVSTSPLSDDPTTGTWEFADSEASIFLDKGTSDEQKQKINTLDNSTLEIVFTDTDFGGEVTVRFAKK